MPLVSGHGHHQGLSRLSRERATLPLSGDARLCRVEGNYALARVSALGAASRLEVFALQPGRRQLTRCDRRQQLLPGRPSTVVDPQSEPPLGRLPPDLVDDLLVRSVTEQARLGKGGLEVKTTA